MIKFPFLYRSLFFLELTIASVFFVCLKLLVLVGPKQLNIISFICFNFRGSEWCGSWPAGSTCCGSNGQIHTDYRNPVEKKGRPGCSLSEREGEKARERARPLPGQAFIAFLGTLHGGWPSFTMHRFTTGDYLLQTTKERMLLITSKRRMLQLKGESGWTGYTPYFGGLAQTLGS